MTSIPHARAFHEQRRAGEGGGVCDLITVPWSRDGAVGVPLNMDVLPHGDVTERMEERVSTLILDEYLLVLKRSGVEGSSVPYG